MKKSLLPLFLIFFLDNFGFSLVYALFGPLVLEPRYGLIAADATLVYKNLILGVLYASFPFAQFFGSPLIGDLADHFGRKRIFYITIIGTIIGYTLSAIAIAVHSVILLISSRVVTGFVAGNLGICLASIADITATVKSRGRYYGLISAVGGLSWVIAMIVGGYVSDPRYFGYDGGSLPFMIAAIGSLLALFFTWLFYSDTRLLRYRPLEVNFAQGVHNILTSFKIKEVRHLYVIYFLWVIGFGGALQWFTPLSIEKFSISQETIAFVLMIFGLLWAAGGAFINWFLLRKLSPYTVVIIALLIVTTCMVIAATTVKYDIVTWSYLLTALFGGLVMSNVLTLVSIASPAGMQGKMMGLSQSIVALAWMVGSIVSSIVASYTIKDVLFYVSFVMILAICLLLIRKKTPFNDTQFPMGP